MPNPSDSTKFCVGHSTVDGKMIRVDIEGHDDQLTAINAAIGVLQYHKRTIERHRRATNS